VIEILDREPVIGTAMLAGEKPLDDLLGNQFEIANASEASGIEVGH
jgi:hypothetical protein